LKIGAIALATSKHLVPHTLVSIVVHSLVSAVRFLQFNFCRVCSVV